MADATVEGSAPAVKKCSRCGSEKPLSQFHRDNAQKDGACRICKECACAVTRAWNAENKARKQQYGRVWHQKNAGKIIKKVRRWAKANPDRVRESRKRSKARIPERYQATRKRCYQKHKQKRLAESIAWQKRNPERVKEIAKRSRAKNVEKLRRRRREHRAKYPERYLEAGRRSRLRHPETKRRNEARRRAQKRKASIGDERAISLFYAAVASEPRIRCYWCGKPTKPKDRHVDHIVPLSRRGAHAAFNLCCACKKCNLKKQSKAPEAFSGQHFLAFSIPQSSTDESHPTTTAPQRAPAAPSEDHTG